jgi:hypothetical protein
MNIAEEIYQHAKRLPSDKALEVLNFITAIETQNQAPLLKSLTTQEFIERFAGSIPDFPEIEKLDLQERDTW